MVNRFPVENIGVQSPESLFQNLKDALGKISNADGTPVLIITDDRANAPENQTIHTLVNCKCSKRIHIMAIALILRKLGRPCPLFLSLHFQSPESEIKNWMSHYQKRDCIASLDLVRGFEFDHIIDLCPAVEARSRAIVQFIQIFQNWFLTASTVKKLFLKNGHKCDQIFNELVNGPLTDFDQDDFSITKLIGKNLFQ